MSSYEAKPCPFCGRTDTLEFIQVSDSPDQYKVNCNAIKGGCGADSGAGKGFTGAIVKWNTRTRSDSVLLSTEDVEWDENYRWERQKGGLKT